MSDRGNVSRQEREEYTRQWRMADIPLVMREHCCLDRHKLFGKNCTELPKHSFLNSLSLLCLKNTAKAQPHLSHPKTLVAAVTDLVEALMGAVDLCIAADALSFYTLEK